MLREFESPAYVRILLLLGMAIVGMAIMVIRFSDSISIGGQLFGWLQ